MTSLKVFNKFNEKLVTSLPMKDVIFLAKLTSRELFPGDLKDQVKEKSSLAEAADHFLDNSIKKDLKNDVDESFLKLLSAMEEFSPQLKTLAAEIQDQLLHKVLSKNYQPDDFPKASGQSMALLYTHMQCNLFITYVFVMCECIQCTYKCD